MKKLFAIVIASVFGLATVTAFATTPAAPVTTAADATAPAIANPQTPPQKSPQSDRCKKS